MEFLAFYNWLVEKYPLILVDAVYEESQGNSDGTDLSKKNPDGLQYDNLYVDMKWILRSCFRPKDKRGSVALQEIFLCIFEYIDQLFAIIRPRKLLYLAVDGVLPRSQMNLHRGHCFQIAKEAELPFEDDNLSKEPETICQLAPSKTVVEVWDPNIIAPGTEFMASLTVAIKYYIRLRINHDLGWRNIKVIFSDASVPGDGKHKIMSYIRLQRNLPGYDPNTRHCLFGLNVDSLMMALATHEVHFSILHETIVPRTLKKLSPPSQHSHLVRICNVDTESKEDSESIAGRNFATCEHPYQFLQLWILREYLEDDLRIPDPLFEIDFEHLIDDLVFMCFLVGGDFLPQMPIFKIQGVSMNFLMDVYKKEFTKMGGYLIESGEVNLKRIEHFIQVVGTFDNTFIKKQVNRELGWRERYYAEKFDTHTTEDDGYLKRELVLKYMEGLCWIMRYYYQGVCSWQWYYPYHYAPFASDLKDLDELEITFFLGKPFKPFEHLMGVLPLASAHVLPEQFRRLMTDPNSPISDFYPQELMVDMDGKDCLSWGFARLPFIDETRLLAETRKNEGTLTESESMRNTTGSDILFLSCLHPLAPHIFSLYACNDNGIDQPGIRMKEVDPVASEGLNGFMALCDEDPCPSTVLSPIDWMDNISNNYTLCVMYKCPPNHRHIARPVVGVIIPEKVVKDTRLDFTMSQVSGISIEILDDGSRVLSPEELKDQAATTEETLSHLSHQDLISGHEGNLLGLPSCEPLQLSIKTWKSPPGFEHVVPASVTSTVSMNLGSTRSLDRNQNSSNSLPSPVDSLSPNMMLSQQHIQTTHGPSVSPSVTCSFSPTNISTENVYVSPSTFKFTVNQVASGGHSPNESPVQVYNSPAYIPSSTGSSVVPSNVSPRKDSIHSYNASKAMPALQGGRSISQYSTFTPSPAVSSVIPPNVSSSKNPSHSYTGPLDFMEFQGARSGSQYPQSLLPGAHHHQIMHRAPLGQHGFSGFVPRGGPQAPHMPMRPLGHSQQPGTMPPHPWITERGAGPSPPPFFPHGQNIGAAPYIVDNRPGNFARGRGMGPRHPNAVFY